MVVLVLKFLVPSAGQMAIFCVQIVENVVGLHVTVVQRGSNVCHVCNGTKTVTKTCEATSWTYPGSITFTAGMRNCDYGIQVNVTAQTCDICGGLINPQTEGYCSYHNRWHQLTYYLPSHPTSYTTSCSECNGKRFNSMCQVQRFREDKLWYL